MNAIITRFGRTLTPVIILLMAAAGASASTANRKAESSIVNKTQVTEAQQLLSGLGFMVESSNGRMDFMTRHAVMAYQKVAGLKRTGILTSSVLESMRSASKATPKYNGAAHIEVDITRQVLFVVDDYGYVNLIVPVSTGSGERYFDKERSKWEVASTPRGVFSFERKINGTRKAPLGQIYYPSYFLRGWAVHGSNSIPATPASHGCVRVPRGADKVLFDMMPVGMKIYLYD